MSNLYITELQGVGKQSTSDQQAATQPAITQQKVAFTGTAGVSAALNANTSLVRITVDGIASIRFSTAASDLATTSYPRMAADTVEYYAVQPGATTFISAITNT